MENYKKKKKKCFVTTKLPQDCVHFICCELFESELDARNQKSLNICQIAIYIHQNVNTTGRNPHDKQQKIMMIRQETIDARRCSSHAGQNQNHPPNTHTRLLQRRLHIRKRTQCH